MNRRRALEAAALAAPLAVVFALRSFSGPSIAGAAAVETSAAASAFVFPEPPTIRLTREQQAALEWAREQPAPARSPMYYVARATEATSASSEPASARPGETFRLSVVMESAGRSLAVINGKIYAIGDTVSSGWQLTSIDARTRSAVVMDGTGRTITLKADR